MGARGSGSFENDTASDWAFGLEGVNDTSLIESTLEKVIGVGASTSRLPMRKRVWRRQRRWPE